VCSLYARVEISDLELSKEVFDKVKAPAELKVFLEEHPEVNVSHATDGGQSLHRACNDGLLDSTVLLLDHKADVNLQGDGGFTPLFCALNPAHGDETALLLLERGADVHIKTETEGFDALYCAFLARDRPMTFVVLCYGADAKNIVVDRSITRAKVDAAIAEYKNTQIFIEKYHELLEHTLSNLVEVDTRMALRSTGIYQEPLERTLEYLGLSMHADQVVNNSIDRKTRYRETRRVLIPNQARNAKHWFEKSVSWASEQQ
jgi:hypothetical protein